MECLCDNAAVVAIVKLGSSKDPTVMHLMRCLFFFVAHYQLVLLPAHIPGKENVVADHLSRGALSSFFQLVPGARKDPKSSRCRAHGGSGDSTAGLDVGSLESRATYYFAKGLAGSSQKTYKSGENRYIPFCQLCNCTPLPVSESVLYHPWPARV